MIDERMIKMKTECFVEAWRRGNDNGEGYIIGEEHETPLQAAKKGGLECIIQVSQEGSVLGYDSDGRAIVVCDLHGPWAVDVTDYMD